jgi:carbon storage regulator
MLVLTRKVGEAIVIDEHITVKLLEIKGSQIKLGIEAPSQIAVHRQEILARILDENQKAAASATATDLDSIAHLLEQRDGQPGGT